MKPRHRRPLYIIAPTLFEAYLAAREWGLDSRVMEGVRAITSAYALRGTRPGTAFITWNRESWGRDAQGYELDRAVTICQRTGRLRPAGDDDIALARDAGISASRREAVR